MRRLAVVVALLGLAVALRAQAATPQPPAAPPQNQPPVFRGNTNVVRVDVAVTDHRGNPVEDLRKEDFHVFEDNIPQTIQTIKMIEASGAAPATDESLPIRSREHAAQEAAKDDIRVFVIFWDEYHIGQFEPAIRARQALTEFARTAFGPTDLVALMDQLTLTDDIRFSRDRLDLENDIHKLQGRQGLYLPPRSAVEESQLCATCNTEVLRSQVTASALESTIAFLGALKEGRKAILLVSQTIGRVGSGAMDTEEWLQKAIDAANSNNTSIYVLDPRGLSLNSRPSLILRSLAENTGGKMFANNFPGPDLRQIVKDESAYYLLGYSSSQNPADGKFHRIRVKVDRPGIEVKARSGYLAPTLAELEGERKTSPAPPPDVTKALEAIADAPHMPVTGDLWVGAAPGSNGTPQVTIAWTPRETTAAPTPSRDVFGSVHATSGDGHVLLDGPLADGHTTLPASPGVVQVRHDTIEADGGLGARTEVSVEVPDFARAPLSMSTPVVYLARTPLEFRKLLQNPSPAPYAGRRFDRTDRVLLRFALFGADAPNATAAATLLSHAGTKLAALPMTSDHGHYQLELPVGSIARGDYVIAIEAAQGANRVKALVPIKVVPE